MLRPSYEAIKASTKASAKSLMLLAREAVTLSMGYEDAAIVVAEMMKAYGKANPDDPKKTSYVGANPEKLEKMIFEEGGPKVIARLGVILTNALTGGFTSEGEVKAIREKK